MQIVRQKIEVATKTQEFTAEELAITKAELATAQNDADRTANWQKCFDRTESKVGLLKRLGFFYVSHPFLYL
jgi:hypothetical protein